jgi:hypothetical protein
MGHVIVGSNANYRPQDPEYYRKRYELKALPFLRLETPTPLDTNEMIITIKEQYQNKIDTQQKEIDAMKETMTKLQPIISIFGNLDLEDLNQFFKKVKTKRPVEISDKETLTTLYISPALDKELMKLAKKHGISKNELTTRLVENAVKNRKQSQLNDRTRTEGQPNQQRTTYITLANAPRMNPLGHPWSAQGSLFQPARAFRHCASLHSLSFIRKGCAWANVDHDDET